MGISIGEAKLGFAEYLPALLQDARADSRRETYEQNRHRIYCLAFLMTDNELVAEQLMTQAFCRALRRMATPSEDEIDSALIVELRELMPLGSLTLNCAPCDRVLCIRRNTLRVDLERAVVQLPNTEKLIFLMHDVEGYGHSRIARLLKLTEEESRRGVHQARLRLRELLAN